MLLVINAIASDSDRSFMEALYVDNYPYMVNAARRILAASPNIEDVVEDAVISLIGKIDLLRSLSVDKRRKYVVVTAKNAALQEVRRHGTRKDMLRLGLYDVYERIADPTQGPLAQLIEKESLEEMREIISQLSDVDQLILYYRTEMHYNCLEIAEIMNISHPACRTRLARARKKIHSLWGDKGVMSE